MLEKIRSYLAFERQLTSLAEEIKGLKVQILGHILMEYPFFMLTTPTGAGMKKILLSGGIHGNEPAGVAALLDILSTLKKEPALIEQFHLTLFPCLNPFGYEHHTRENSSGVDLNRQYGKRTPPQEVRLVRAALMEKRFDLSMEFHEDIDTPGFYLYEICDEARHAAGDIIVKEISKKYPINLQAEIEGAPAVGGVINPEVASSFFKKRMARRGEWPQAIYLHDQGTPHCITSETPTFLDMHQRVDMHLTVFKIALRLCDTIK